MLSIFLSEELERCVEDSHDATFVQYFCDNKDKRQNTAFAILRGLIWQLLKCRPQLINHILPSFKDRSGSYVIKEFNSLWRIFEAMIHDPILGTAYCVLDGLDECEEDSLMCLLKKFEALFSAKHYNSSASRLNLIAISRDLPDFIPDILSSFPCIRLDMDTDTEINSDICRFIEMKVNELSIYRHYPEQLRVHIREVLLDRANGTFLWVGIVANEPRKYASSEVKNALERIPSGLEALYARMLLQISPDRQEATAKILRWVVMAVRPLTISELSAAVEPTTEISVGLTADEVIKDQISFCGYFLTIKQHEVSLIHQSAKDYLLRNTPDANWELEFFRVKKEQVNSEITRRCLAYLSNGALAEGALVWDKLYFEHADMKRQKAFRLLSYAILHWPEHARSLISSEDIFDLSQPFFMKKSPVRQSWLDSYRRGPRDVHLSRSIPLLYLACFLGIFALVQKLLCENGWRHRLKYHININKKDGDGKALLHRAITGGNELIVRLLLEKGADIETKDGYGQTALHIAA
ncbi:hypothetical protein GJ744_000540 [Endocarpon pusillum]|uniref:NACHT domain-containing protein n=1 Tax=Endocarpon pusillum TaxID=364733 RepID=A0A8H7E3W6_9EURO|nr:hypothetical protein GJ744_000540 [Endocarpon pusillum]